MRKYRRPLVIIATGLFLLLFTGVALSGCAPDKPREYAGPSEKVRIGIDRYSSDHYGLFTLADIEGFFKEQGLDVSFVSMSSGAEAIRSLRQGGVDIGMGTEFPVVREIIQGHNIRIITTVWHGEVLCLAGRRDRGIRNPSDIRGKRIAVPLGTQLEFFLGRYLLYNGMTLEDIVIADTNLLDLLDAFLLGKADGVIFTEHDLAVAHKKIGENIVSWSAQAEQPTYGVVICRSEFVKYKPDIVKRLLRALLLAEISYRDNPHRALALIREHPTRKDSYYRDDIPLMSYSLSLEKPFLIMLEDEARWCIERGESHSGEVPNCLDYIYFEALESVKPDGISIIR